MPVLNQLTLRGGICGRATKAAPVSPKSARQMAFQVALVTSSGAMATHTSLECHHIDTLVSVYEVGLGCVFSSLMCQVMSAVSIGLESSSNSG